MSARSATWLWFRSKAGTSKPPTSLTLTPRQIQQGGVAYEPVIRRRLYREIDTTGRIASDERREAKITSWVRGKSRIEKLYIDLRAALKKAS